MATFTKEFLSGSTNGRPIKVTGTATGSAVTIHTAHATAKDEVYLHAVNTSAADVILTIEFGGTTSPDDLIPVKIKKDRGLTLIIPGQILSNSLLVKAFAASANVINITGWINRVTP